MSILLISNTYLISYGVKELLERNNYKFVCIREPNGNQEDFLTELLLLVKENDVHASFSMNFYPQISLACGALGIKYFSWIVDSGTDDAYSIMLKNEWNYIYTADYTLYERLKDKCSINYFQTGYTTESAAESFVEPNQDLLFWSGITGSITSISKIMDELKDSTKGYIDSMIEQKKNDLCTWDLYDRFADYIKKDVEAQYSVGGDSLATKAWLYERTFFYKALDETYAFPYIHFLHTLWNKKERISLALEKTDDLPMIEARKISQTDIISGGYTGKDNYQVIIMFPRINEGNMIPIDAWNFLTQGNVVFLPEWIYTGDESPFIKFKNKRELYYKIYSLLQDDIKIQKLKKQGVEYAVSNGSLENRIKRLINTIN